MSSMRDFDRLDAALRRRAAIEDPEDGYTLAGEMLEEITRSSTCPPRRPSFAPPCIAW
jgi:hypothetical protein